MLAVRVIVFLITYALFFCASFRAAFRPSLYVLQKVLAQLVIAAAFIVMAHLWTPTGLWVGLAAALLSFTVLSKTFSLEDSLRRRIRRVTTRLARGNCVLPVTDLMVLGQEDAELLYDDQDKELSPDHINALAMELDGAPWLGLTPLAAMLPEDELAFVIGHELGHHSLGHVEDTTTNYFGGFLGTPLGRLITAVAGGLAALAGVSARLVGSLALMGYLRQRSQQRAAELDADRFSMNRLTDTGYDPRAALRFMDRISQARHDASPCSLLEHLVGSHPSIDTRRRHLEQHLAQGGT